MIKKAVKKTAKKTFIIDRSKWRAGGLYAANANCIGRGNTEMLNVEGFMCCLGQIADQCGVAKKHLLCASSPEIVRMELEFHNSKVPAKFKFLLGKIGDDAIHINDNDKESATAKQRRLKKLFNRHNISLKFVGHCIRDFTNKGLRKR